MRFPSCAALLLAGVLPGQGAILDLLDGETLYDGGFLLTLGQELARRDTLFTGSSTVGDPLASHEFEHRTALALQYGLRHDLQVGVALDWVHTEAEALGTSVDATGFGDVELLAKYRFLRFDARGSATNLALLGGLSLPTGDDDVRRGGSELPPDLQPGSGGVDPMVGAAITHEPGRWRFNAAARWQLRTDTDGDGDRRGHDVVAELAAGNRFWLEPYPGPFMRLDLLLRYYAEARDRMDGLLADTGGDRWTAGLTWAFRPQPALDLQLYVELPLHQHLRGTQLGTDWVTDLTFGWRF